MNNFTNQLQMKELMYRINGFAKTAQLICGTEYESIDEDQSSHHL
jgi:hypothetical protein